jgi:peptide chain release factor 2
MQTTIHTLEELLAAVRGALARLGIPADEARLADLDAQALAPDFWSDPSRASATSKQAAALRRHVGLWRGMEQQVSDTLELSRLGDASLQSEVEETTVGLVADFEARRTQLKLSGPYDRNTALVSIYAGTGGTDAQDWAEMLLRMYLRWCETNELSVEVLDRSDGETAGIKSVTFEVSGQFAYGRLQSEKGVHRLVRLSPFNSDSLRQTSFALVDVVPEIAVEEQLDIDPGDLRIDVYRSGGNGGQSVNTTDSAVRITHLPTGLVVAIQNERSQLQNREKAMTILQARLAALLLEQHKEKLSEIRGATQSAEWGNQIRSYVLHPYTMVKDHRTGAETAQALHVLEGDIDMFIEAYLDTKIGSTQE